ncbi:MAG: site-specific integrase [Chitinophagaceae bacterium]|nr:MAG: site-specific integrase [Chitinophagaceae bacterium]
MNLEGRVIQTSKITKWTPGTVAAARTYFTSFFNWCMAKARKYIDENPMHGINEMKINSNNEAPERHMPFSTEQLRAVLQYLDENDKYMALFCRSIFYTCVRPKELRGLRVADINLNNGTMKVRMDVMKTSQKPKPDIVHLDRNFIPHLEQLNLHTFPPHYRLFSGNFEKVVGEKSVGVNTPLNRLKTALQKLGLNGKGHGVYSFKHTSNIQRLNAGWELAQIMKANRHSSITETEKYLKGLLALTDISKLEVPAF